MHPVGEPVHQDRVAPPCRNRPSDLPESRFLEGTSGAEIVRVRVDAERRRAGCEQICSVKVEDGGAMSPT